MEAKGATFADALAQAQKLGFAEADPRGDIDGFDARAKLVILTQAGLRLQVRSEQILCAADLHDRSNRFSLRARAELHDPPDFAGEKGRPATGGRQAVRLRASRAGSAHFADRARAGEPQHRHRHRGVCRTDRAFSGYGAGGDPTAVAVVSDLYAIARRAGARPAAAEAALGSPASVSGELTVPHYLRFVVRDRPGIVAEVATVLSKHHIGIDASAAKARLSGFRPAVHHDARSPAAASCWTRRCRKSLAWTSTSSRRSACRFCWSESLRCQSAYSDRLPPL